MKDLTRSWKIILSTIGAVVTATSFGWSIVQANQKILDLKIEKTEKDLKEIIQEMKVDFREFAREQRDFNQSLIKRMQ